MSAEEFNYHQSIEEYLLGMMTSAERSSFEKEMAGNPELQKEVNAHRLATDIVIERRLLDVKATLKTIDQKASFNAWKWILGGGLGLAVMAGYLFLSTQASEPVVAVSQHEVTLEQKAPDIQQEKEIISESTDGKIAAPKAKVIVHTTTSTEVATENIPSSESLPLEKNPLQEVLVAKAEEPKEINKQEDNSTKPVPVPLDPCKWVTLSADISVTPTCQGKSEGMVRVAHIKGGTLPYKTTLLDEKNQEVANASLSKGVYAIVITDAKGCSQRFERVGINSKACSENIVFNPTLGETWEIPFSEQDGVLKIYDNAGTLYFWKEIQGFEKEQWSGRASNGDQKQGYFLYEIQYKDGSSAQGSITLVK